MEATALKQLAELPMSVVGSKCSKNLSIGAGAKSTALSGTAHEVKRLQEYLSEQKGALSAQRVATLKTLSRGEWKADLLMVEITRKKGSHWMIHGHTHLEGRLLLLPEEAVFLMECGSLEVFWCGVPFSLQQAYQVMLVGIPPHHYQVYCCLKRMGYIVYRVHLSMDAQATEGTEGGGVQEVGESQTPITKSCCPLCSSVHSLASCQQLLEVYRPQSNFHKSKPGPPDLRVVIATPTDPFPPPTLVKHLSATHPTAPLKYCIVDGSSTSYYSIQAAAIAKIAN